MYLTRIQLDGRQALALKLVDPYAWHQRLWDAFPGRDGQTRDFLSRTDVRAGRHETLLLSPSEPTPPAWGQWETKRIAQGFLEHDAYVFDLRANPVASRPIRPADGGPRPRGRRVPILDPDSLTAWVRRKAETCGFSVELDKLKIGTPIRQPFRKAGGSGVHTRVDFQGVLTVRDAAAFKNAFRSGIGPAKAFGFGMLMLQPMEC